MDNSRLAAANCTLFCKKCTSRSVRLKLCNCYLSFVQEPHQPGQLQMALAIWRQAMLRGIRQTFEHLEHSLWRAPVPVAAGQAGLWNRFDRFHEESPSMPSMPSASEIFGHWCYNLRPREFSVRLDVKMKRAAAPYPRNPNRKKPVPKVKGIIRKLIK